MRWRATGLRLSSTATDAVLGLACSGGVLRAAVPDVRVAFVCAAQVLCERGGLFFRRDVGGFGQQVTGRAILRVFP